MKKNSLLLLSLFFLFSCAKTTTSSNLSTSENENVSSSETKVTYSKALNAIKTLEEFKVQGEVYQKIFIDESIDEGEEIKVQNISAIFKKNKYKLINEYIIDDSILDTYENTYIKGEDNYTYFQYIDVSNKICSTKVLDYYNEPILFDDSFVNPFKNLRYSDFFVNDNKVIANNKASKLIANNLLHANIDVNKVSLTVENDQFKTITIESNSSLGSLGVNQSYKYTLNIIDSIKSDDFVDLKPYEIRSENDPLRNAFLDMDKKISTNNYTIETTINVSNQNTNYIYYATEDVCFSETTSLGISYGAKLVNNNMEFFTYSDSNITFVDEVGVRTRDMFNPDFSIVSADIFEYDQESKMFYAFDDMLKLLCFYLTPYFESSFYQEYAYSLAIKLKEDNTIDFINVKYVLEDSMASGDVKISFKDFNNTVLPTYLIF